MNFIHKSSQECAKSELDLFHTPETQAMILSGKWVDYHPISVIDGNSPLEFTIPGSGDEYTDLSQTYLHVECKVENSNGTNLVADKVIAPVNLLFYSLFSQCDIKWNDTLVTASSNMYTYRCIFEILVNYGPDALNSLYQSAFFHKDTAGNLDSLTVLPGASDVDVPKYNYGFHKRCSLVKESQVISLMGRLHGDILFQDRYLINNVEMKIRLSRNKHSFCLMGDTNDYRLNLLKATLFVRKA